MIVARLIQSLVKRYRGLGPWDDNATAIAPRSRTEALREDFRQRTRVWWRQPSSTRLRDYYRVEDAEGRRYWFYREGLIGDGRGGLPNWYMHGLFGR